MTAAIEKIKPVPARYDWENAPLDQAERHLAELRLALQHADMVMTTRRSTPTPTYVCWTQTMLDSKFPDGSLVISVQTRPACKREGTSGREAFRDDGAKDEYGNRVTIRVCSYQCYQDYIRWKGMQRLQGGGAPR
jgi:hypothetical protein